MVKIEMAALPCGCKVMNDGTRELCGTCSPTSYTFNCEKCRKYYNHEPYKKVPARFLCPDCGGE